MEEVELYVAESKNGAPFVMEGREYSRGQVVEYLRNEKDLNASNRFGPHTTWCVISDEGDVPYPPLGSNGKDVSVDFISEFLRKFDESASRHNSGRDSFAADKKKERRGLGKGEEKEEDAKGSRFRSSPRPKRSAIRKIDMGRRLPPDRGRRPGGGEEEEGRTEEKETRGRSNRGPILWVSGDTHSKYYIGEKGPGENVVSMNRKQVENALFDLIKGSEISGKPSKQVEWVVMAEDEEKPLHDHLLSEHAQVGTFHQVMMSLYPEFFETDWVKRLSAYRPSSLPRPPTARSSSPHPAAATEETKHKKGKEEAVVDLPGGYLWIGDTSFVVPANSIVSRLYRDEPSMRRSLLQPMGRAHLQPVHGTDTPGLGAIVRLDPSSVDKEDIVQCKVRLERDSSGRVRRIVLDVI